MERLKGVEHNHQFSTLQISKSTKAFIRFKGEVENKSLLKPFLACLQHKTILKEHVTQFTINFPTRHNWGSFFHNEKDMNEMLPGNRQIRFTWRGYPEKWFSPKESGLEKPRHEGSGQGVWGNGDTDPYWDVLPSYRNMTGRNFRTFSFQEHLIFQV